MDKVWEAGVLQGQVHLAWSRHSTRDAAERAARRYARKKACDASRDAYGAGELDGWVRESGGAWECVEVAR